MHAITNRDELLQALADGRPITRADVPAKLQRQYVWSMMYSAPGCLPDHSEVCGTRRDALESARFLYADDAPRGFVSDLRRYGIAAADEQGFYRVEVTRVRVSDLF